MKRRDTALHPYLHIYVRFHLRPWARFQFEAKPKTSPAKSRHTSSKLRQTWKWFFAGKSIHKYACMPAYTPTCIHTHWMSKPDEIEFCTIFIGEDERWHEKINLIRPHKDCRLFRIAPSKTRMTTTTTMADNVGGTCTQNGNSCNNVCKMPNIFDNNTFVIHSVSAEFQCVIFTTLFWRAHTHTYIGKCAITIRYSFIFSDTEHTLNVTEFWWIGSPPH